MLYTVTRESLAAQEMEVRFLGQVDPPWRRKWQPTPVFLPGESQGQEAWWAAVYGVAQSRTLLK